MTSEDTHRGTGRTTAMLKKALAAGRGPDVTRIYILGLTQQDCSRLMEMCRALEMPMTVNLSAFEMKYPEFTVKFLRITNEEVHLYSPKIGPQIHGADRNTSKVFSDHTVTEAYPCG